MEKIYKYFIIILVVIVSIHSAFTSPGFSSFEIFSQQIQVIFQSLGKHDIGVFFRFPPTIYLILSTLLAIMPHETTGFFYLLPVWYVFKAILLINYITIYWALNSFSKSLSKKQTDVSLYYFLSFSIMLCINFLSFFDLIAAPFFIFSLAFLNTKRIRFGTIFFIVSLLCNPYLAIFAPFIYFSHRSTLDKKVNFILFRNTFLFFPIAIAIAYIYLLILQKPFLFETPIKLFGLPWFSMAIISNVSKIVKGTANLPITIVLMISLISIINFFAKIFINLYPKIKRFYLIGIFFIIILIGASLSFTIGNNFIFLYFIFSVLYGLSIIKFQLKLSSENITSKLYQYLYAIVFIFLIFFPEISPGNLGWLTIFALLEMISNPNVVNKIKLVLTNVLVFAGLYVFLGINGKQPEIDPLYLSIFIIILSGIFICTGLWYYKNTITTLNNNIENKLKWILAGTIVTFALTFVLSQGTVDVSIYNGMNKILIEYSNPYTAHPFIGNQYPPLSTIVYFSLTHTWNYIVGFQSANVSNIIGNYAIPTKISGAFLYLLFPLVLLIFRKQFGAHKSLSKINLLLIILTTFSLSLQSINLGDLDIYTVIPMFIAIILLTKNLSFFSGIVLGIASTLKWQPMLLLPIFIITLFSKQRNFRESIKHTALFTIGMIMVIAIVWIPLLFQPEGIAIFQRDFIGFFLGSPPYLSGQALNVDWIVTYYLHIFNPTNYGVLDKNLNWCIGTTSAPKIFQGYLFKIIASAVIFKYWISYKKTLPYILSAILILFFSHHMLNKGAYENHFFYPVLFMLLLYICKPTKTNRLLLILLDIMSFMNQALFYGVTGASDIKRAFFGFDITILYSVLYIFIYLIVLKQYFKKKGAL